jgi:hypothetical protein
MISLRIIFARWRNNPYEDDGRVFCVVRDTSSGEYCVVEYVNDEDDVRFGPDEYMACEVFAANYNRLQRG